EVPNHNCARAVIPGRDDAFEIEIRDGMILHLHGQALIGGIERRPFGHRPGLQNTIHFQAEVIVETSSAVLLNNESVTWLLFYGRRRLWSLLKVTLTFVFLERHCDLDAAQNGPAHP